MAGEKVLQNFIQKQCNVYGVLCYKFASPARRGVPDLILVGPQGHVVFIELKNPNKRGRLNALQERELKLLTNNKAEAYVINNKDDALDVITSLKTETKPASRSNSTLRARRYNVDREDGGREDSSRADGHFRTDSGWSTQ